MTNFFENALKFVWNIGILNFLSGKIGDFNAGPLFRMSGGSFWELANWGGLTIRGRRRRNWSTAGRVLDDRNRVSRKALFWMWCIPRREKNAMLCGIFLPHFLRYFFGGRRTMRGEDHSPSLFTQCSPSSICAQEQKQDKESTIVFHKGRKKQTPWDLPQNRGGRKRGEL